jgi:DNA-binding NarL/FixJ family response regulator
MEPTSGPYPFGHDEDVKSKHSGKNLALHPATHLVSPPKAEAVRVLVADSGPLQSQLLTRALRSRREFRVSAVALEASALHTFLQSNPVDVALLTGNQLPDWGLLRWMRITHPKIAPVLLAESDDRDLVVNALRAGAKGIFLFMQDPFRMLCKCISCVSRGEIWLNNRQLQHVLDTLSDVPTLRVVNANGRSLLTPREEQVVALVSDGLTNREVAVELGLSEHTIKKYLLRIFDKVGVSSRVELVLYAMSHGEKSRAEWMPSSA